MEGFGTAFGVLLHDPQLRRGLVMDHEQSARRQSRVRRRLLVWLAGGLHALAVRVEASVSSSTDTRTHPGIANQTLISTRSVGAPAQPGGGPS